jgi:NAD(P)-dependent dehydrogenase (short-subunit alcohol dehydrogenase family)
MTHQQNTLIVTGGSQAIGAGLVKAFLGSGYNVVANSRHITEATAFEASESLALVDGNVAEDGTAAKIAEVARQKFGSIDALVNNACIYVAKGFTDYTTDDLRSLSFRLTSRAFFILGSGLIKSKAANQCAATR